MKTQLKKTAFLARPGPAFMGGALLAMLVTVNPIHAGWLVEDQKLESADVIDEGPYELDGFFARPSVQSVSGNTLAVLNRNDETAYIFVHNGSSWEEQAKLKSGEDYSSSSIAISGDRVVVGARDNGKAYIFERNGAAWTEQPPLELPIADQGIYEHFGDFVAISDDTVVVTAGEVGNRQAGVAYVFTRSGATWTEPVRLDDVVLPYYTFNAAPTITISGNTIVVSKSDSNKVFIRNGTDWFKQATLVGGRSAISDDTIVVLEPRWESELDRVVERVIHIFTRMGSTWSEQDALIKKVFTRITGFGASLAVSGDTFMVGDPGEGDAPTYGWVHVFTRSGTTWNEQTTLKAAGERYGDGFGNSVSIDGDTAVVGSHGGRSYTSSAYVFDLTCDATYSLPSNQWRQISLPCNPGANDSVTSVLGDDIPGTYGANWFVYRYDANGYVPLTGTDSLSQGVGYWIIQTSGSEITLDMPDNSTPTPVISTKAEYEPIACLDLDAPKGCFEIPLVTKTNAIKWNMIGYPFASTGGLGNARIQTESGACDSESGCDLNAAQSQGIIHNQLWNYNGTNYTMVDTSGNLEPWAAYWAATLDQADGANPKLLIPKL